MEQESANFEKIFIPGRNYWREYLIRYTSIILVAIVTTWFELDYHYGDGGFLSAFLISFIRTALIWNGSMLIIQYSVTRYSMFRDTFRIIVFQVVALAVYVLLVEWGEIITIEYLLKINLSNAEKFNLVGVSLLITFMISSIYAATSFFIQWKENLLRAKALEKANLEARYDTLRNQVNPHFLFNSLNTLIMLVNDNPVATKYVESMAEIMRYMLQSGNREVVYLEEEINVALEYVFIQQKRFGDKLVVNVDIPREYYRYAIPPLSLQMLLENAIKHNEVSREYPLQVSVYVSSGKYLVIENSVKPKTGKEPSTGVGLDNIRNRYLYLTGEGISVKNENGKFMVSLPLFERPI